MKNRLCVVIGAFALALPVLMVAGGALARTGGSTNESLDRPALRHPVQNER